MNTKHRAISLIRPSAPDHAVPQPAITLPDGHWIELDFPERIPPLHTRELRLWQRVLLALIRHQAGETYDYACFRVTARLGKIMPLHTLFFSQLLQHGRIPPADSERVVIRVAWRAGCQYEYAHHTRMALAQGVSRSEIETLTNEHDDSWTMRTRVLMAATDELIATRNLNPSTYRQLHHELNDDQILELATLVGHYIMASMMLSVAGCPIEPAFQLTPSDAARLGTVLPQ
jgi:4-carboxymuconolactone decarboxylase